MSSSMLTLGRLFTSFLPEQMLVEKAIEELSQYKQAKFGASIISSEENSNELEEFSENIAHESELPEVDKPMGAVMALILKWGDEGRSLEDIAKEGEQIEEAVATIPEETTE